MRLEDLVNEYKRLDIGVTKSRINSNTLYVEFSNGDTWEVVATSDRSRGRACNVSLIEKCTPEEIVNQVILPCTKNSPYRAYNYYFTKMDIPEYEL